MFLDIIGEIFFQRGQFCLGQDFFRGGTPILLKIFSGGGLTLIFRPQGGDSLADSHMLAHVCLILLTTSNYQYLDLKQNYLIGMPSIVKALKFVL